MPGQLLESPTVFLCVPHTMPDSAPTPSPSLPVPFERKVVLSLAALYSFRMFGLFMLLPVLSVYGSDYADHSPFLLGLALGAYGLSQALLQIPFGVMSDRFGRKPLILAGLLLFALGSVVAAMADSVYGLILGRFLQGCGAISAAVMALLTDLTSEENRTKAMATIGASIGMSFSVAMTLGPVLAAWGGVGAIFWLTAGLGLAGVYILLAVVPNVSVTAAPRREAVAVPNLLWHTLSHPELRRLNLGIFVLHFVLMANFVVLPLVLQNQLAIPRNYHGFVYFPLLALAFMLMLPFVIIAEKRRQIKPVFLAAIGLLLVSELLLVWLSHSMIPALLVLFLFFVAFNLLEATQPSLVSKIAPAGAKGTATGIYATCQVLGVFGGGALGGWLLEQQLGVAAVFMVNAALTLLWLLGAWGMTPPRFLASVLIPLRGRDPQWVADQLRQVNGVAEVVIVSSENMAYLKVDQKLVDRKALATIVDAGPQV
ncbi:major facilitator family transporter [Cellvibrio japonicus Ueda107]|uniref:Major facilitator family transporter n=2 Tax=Cellvibrio japonicus TaxID=155077 RepID=B3PK65_CELJU|nr:major facilitator family transporter [Cellvibrio japonicus Ueda107]